SLKTRLIRVDWIKVDGGIVYKAEKAGSTPPAQNQAPQKQYAENSF
ncbi:DUF3577 domain-containing protein, partial [Salmonella enterica]|nr:DUF3577 domain-containing protein [Salmonella enterica]